MSFSGQTAIVTGGAGGIGKAIVKMLLENGAKVMAFDIAEEAMKSLKEEMQSAGHEMKCCKVDVSDEASVKQGFVEFLQFSDRLDIMVNCAGLIPVGRTPCESMTVDTFDRSYAVNLRGSFLMTKHSIIEMKKNNYGRILLVSSLSGKESVPGISEYNASKAGVIALAKGVGKEYATTGITVNTLAPTAVKTPHVDKVDPKEIEMFVNLIIPMKRLGTVEEVASITKFIVSKEASFNTGCCFDLSGGQATY